jgi:hypothetical protein
LFQINSLGFKPQTIEKQKHSNIVYEINTDKSFFMMVLLIQFGPNGHSQTPFDPTTDDGTSGTVTGGSGGTGGTGGGGTYTGGTSGRNDVPLDGGLSLLLAAGVGYGVKWVNKNFKKR